jgi:hypothetical protein
MRIFDRACNVIRGVIAESWNGIPYENPEEAAKARFMDVGEQGFRDSRYSVPKLRVDGLEVPVGNRFNLASALSGEMPNGTVVRVDSRMDTVRLKMVDRRWVELKK